LEIFSPLREGAVEEVRKRRVRRLSADSTVCRCGHSSNVHKEDPRYPGSGIIRCQPGQGSCRCSQPSPVLWTNNLRLFKHMTTGYGLDHALSKGIVAVLEYDKPEFKAEYKWLDGELVICDACKNPTPFPVPVSILLESNTLVPMHGDAGKIMCENCFQKWQNPTTASE
jgi:hypothetical protein